MTDAPLHSPLCVHATARTLGVVRIVVFALCFQQVADVPIWQLADLPDVLFRPPGFIGLLPDWLLTLLWQPAVLKVFYGTLLALLSAVVLGVRPHHPVAITAVTLLFLFNGLARSHNTYINHAQFAAMYGALVLAFCPAADALSVMSSRPRPLHNPSVYRAAMFLPAAIITVPYMLLGLRRITGGLETFTDDRLIHSIAYQTMNPSEYGFDYGLLLLDHPTLATLAKLGFAIITLFEATAPLVLIHHRFRRAWLAVMIPFHVSTLFTMNIFFWQNVILILLLHTAFLYHWTRDREDKLVRVETVTPT